MTKYIKCPTPQKCKVNKHILNSEAAIKCSKKSQKRQKTKNKKLVPKIRQRKPKLIIMSGLPGSGKSYTAKEIVDNDKNSVEINRDSLRLELFGKLNIGRKNEKKVTEEQHKRIKKALEQGKQVIDSNTNLNPMFIDQLVKIAKEFNAEIEHMPINTPYETCLERNSKREGFEKVPQDVMDKMHKQGYYNGNMKKLVLSGERSALIPEEKTKGKILTENYSTRQKEKYPILDKEKIVFVDLDGTLADMRLASDLSFYHSKRNFKLFHTLAEKAPVNQEVLEFIQELREKEYSIFAVSGRNDKYAQETIKFLENIEAPISELMLRNEFDMRSDIDTKRDILEEVKEKGYTIKHCIDDRQQIIDLWEENGISVSTVEYHEPQDNKEEYTQPLKFNRNFNENF